MSVLTIPASRPVAVAWRLAVTTISLYAAAYLATIMLHETGHAVVSWLLDGRPVQYNTWVRNTNPALSSTAKLYIALAGPLLSLGQGLTLLYYSYRTRQTSSWSLLWLYAGVFGLINFLGYVVIAPLAHQGDSGQIMSILRVPTWLQWGLALLALVALSRLVKRTGPLFLRQLPPTMQTGAEQRAAGLQLVLLWPWALGSLVLLVLSLPSPLLALLYIPTAPMVLRRAYRSALQEPVGEAPAGRGQLRFQWAAVVLMVALAACFRMLAVGIAW